MKKKPEDFKNGHLSRKQNGMIKILHGVTEEPYWTNFDFTE